jgi:hypothetical protein
MKTDGDWWRLTTADRAIKKIRIRRGSLPDTDLKFFLGFLKT